MTTAVNESGLWFHELTHVGVRTRGASYGLSMDEAANPGELRELGAKCLRLARSIGDQEAVAGLRNLAMSCESLARRIEQSSAAGT